MSTSAYPVHVDASLDTHLSRWLWLVKWFLAIPHYVVLAFLWTAFFLLSVLAFFAIVFTGRYPRAIFDFNVGVLRWSWRVAYYTYGALATDRYPPFTLAEVPDYPAHLEVDYPEHLSRGLVWVKWWLLAIPHYLILGILLSGGVYFAYNSTQPGGWDWTGSWGLITLLAVIAAFALLFTGRYPQQLFDLVLGLNRWVLRVAAYASLMTDEYPPFRLDLGGQDPSPGMFAMPSGPPTGPGAPGTAVPPSAGAPEAPTTSSASPSAQPPAQQTDQRTDQRTDQPAGWAVPPTAGAVPTATPAGGGAVRWTAGRVVAVVAAAFVFLLGGGLLAGGTTLAIADQSMRNAQGYLMSPTQTLATGGYALASSPFTIETGARSDWVPRSIVGRVAVRGEAAGGQSIFIGVARSSEAAAYLAGVRHTTLIDLHGVAGSATPVYQESPGGAPRVLPTQSKIWVASASGTGPQQLTWDPKNGDWTVVVMNTDGTSRVAADMSVGATAPVLHGVVIGLLVAGGLLVVLAIALVLVVLNTGRRPTAGTPGGGPNQEGLST